MKALKSEKQQKDALEQLITNTEGAIVRRLCVYFDFHVIIY